MAYTDMVHAQQHAGSAFLVTHKTEPQDTRPTQGKAGKRTKPVLHTRVQRISPYTA